MEIGIADRSLEVANRTHAPFGFEAAVPHVADILQLEEIRLEKERLRQIAHRRVERRDAGGSVTCQSTCS